MTLEDAYLVERCLLKPQLEYFIYKICIYTHSSTYVCPVIHGTFEITSQPPPAVCTKSSSYAAPIAFRYISAPLCLWTRGDLVRFGTMPLSFMQTCSLLFPQVKAQHVIRDHAILFICTDVLSLCEF